MKELFKEKGLWTASLLCLTAMAANLPLDKIKWPLETGSFLFFFQTSLHTKLILFLLPAAAILPMGAVYVREYSSGFLKLYLVRISRMEYVKRKIIEIYAGGFVVFFLSGIVWFCLCFLFLYPLELTGNITWNMVWEALFLLLRISLIGGMTAELAGIFGTLFQNYYMSYGLPSVCFYMLILLKERFVKELYVFYPAEWIKCEQDWGADRMGIWIFLGVFSAALMLLHGLVLYARLKEVS